MSLHSVSSFQESGILIRSINYGFQKVQSQLGQDALCIKVTTLNTATTLSWIYCAILQNFQSTAVFKTIFKNALHQ